MKQIKQLIDKLKGYGIRLKVDNQQLSISAPKGVLQKHPDLLAELKKNKKELLKVLSKETATNTHQKVEYNDRHKFNPLSRSQKRIWFHQQTQPNSYAYHMPNYFEIQGDITLDKLCCATQIIMEHSEVLRMAFIEQGDGIPLSAITHIDHIKPPIKHIEINHTTELNPAIQNFIQAPFDLTVAPLFRIGLFSIANASQHLVIVFHHIIADGWSINLFMNQLQKYYQSTYINKETINRYDYLEYVNWHQQWIQNDTILKEHKQYWLKRLAGLTNYGELPGDLKRPDMLTFNGASQRHPIQPDVVSKLKQFTKKSNCTLYVVFFALYSLLFMQYTHEDETVIGTPVSGRSQAEFESTIGLFINTLPIRIKASDELTFIDFCQKFMMQFLDDMDHQDYPFDQIIDLLNYERNTTQNPLYQTMFLLTEDDENPIKLGTSQLVRRPIELGTCHVDLTFGIRFSANNSAAIELEYNTAIYTSNWINRFCDNFLYLLDQISKIPNIHLQDIRYISPSEQQQLIESSGLNHVDYNLSHMTSVIDMIEESVSTNPTNIAIKDETTTLTYHVLWALSDKFVAIMKDTGIKANDVVAIKMERSCNMIIAMVAIWKLGATYLAVDPKYPISRVTQIFKTAQVKSVIYGSKASIPIEYKTRSIDIAKLYEKATTLECSLPLNRTASTAPAYIIFTSGSSGTPLATKVEHRGIANLVNAYKAVFSISNHERFSQFSAQSFDAFACEVWPALSVGASVHIINEDDKISPQDTINFLAKNKITIADIPSSIAPAIWEASTEQLALRVMKIGGEAIRQYPNQDLPYFVYNCYGTVETTIESTYECIHTPDASNQSNKSFPPAIGRSFPGIGVFVLDKNNKLAPYGAKGEIFIFGKNIAAGYINNQTLEQKRFIKIHLEGLPPLSGFKTGDIGKWQSLYKLEFLGRKDRQVKIRNFRIELDEIEKSIESIPDVLKAAVIAYGKKIDQKKLVAYIVSKHKMTVNEIRRYLKIDLPDYMLPNLIIFLEKMPLTQHNKIDYKALPQPIQSRHDNTGFVPATTHLEQTLVKIWQQVLQIERVGITDNFFQLGGDSLSSIQISAQSRQHGILLKPLLLHQHQTIQEIIKKIPYNENREALKLNKKNTLEGKFPLSPIQKWFIHQNYHTPNHFNQAQLFKITMPTSSTIHRKGISWLLEQHEILKAKLVKNNKQYYIDNSMSVDNHIEEIIIDTKNLHQFSERVERICFQIQSQFNLYDGPLFKSILITNKNKEHQRLFLIAHHLLVDAVSWRIIKDDLEYVFTKYHAKENIVLPLPKSSHYHEWTYKLVSEISPNQTNFKDICKTIVSKHVLSNQNSQMHLLHVPCSEVRMMESLAQTIQLRFHEVQLAIIAKFIGKLLDKTRLSVEMESHGRFEEQFNDIDLTRSIGWYTTLYPGILTINNGNEDLLSQVYKISHLDDRIKLTYLLSNFTNYQENKIEAYDFCFNYHGKTKNKNRQSLLANAPETISGFSAAANHRSALINVNSYLNNTGLHIELTLPTQYKAFSNEISEFNKILKKIIQEFTNTSLSTQLKKIAS